HGSPSSRRRPPPGLSAVGPPARGPSPPAPSPAAGRPAPRFLADAPPLAVPLLALRRSGTGWLLSRTTGVPAEPGHGPTARRARRARRLVRDRAEAATARRRLLVRRLCVQARAYAELLLDLLLDLVGEVGVVTQEVARVLLALPELVAPVGVPGTGLAHDGLFHPEVDEATLPANPDPKQDVK